MSLYIGIAHVVDTVVRVGTAVLDALFPPGRDDIFDLADALGRVTPEPRAPRVPRPRVEPTTLIDWHTNRAPELDQPIAYLPTGYQPASEFDVDTRSLGEQWSDASLEQAMEILRWGADEK